MVNMLDDVCSMIYGYMKDSRLKSFSIINAERREDAQAIIYIDNHLGIESWCVEELYCYVHNKTLSRKPERLEEISTVACLLNPNSKTFWNIRRELVLKQQLCYSHELLLISRLLSYRAKCHEAYVYRKWLITHMLNNNISHSHNMEYKFVKSIATVLTNNHLVWDYFRAVLRILVPDIDIITWTMKIYLNMTKWIERNVSDASAMSFLAFIFSRVLRFHEHIDEELKIAIHQHISNTQFNMLTGADSVQVGLVLYELKTNQDMIKFFPNHEALWSYRRFLTYVWLMELPFQISENGARKLDNIALLKGIREQFGSFYHNINEPFLAAVDNNNEWYIKRFESWWQSVTGYRILV